MCRKSRTDIDLIHNPPNESIYLRTDYIVNSDLSIPLALAGSWRHGIATEQNRRPGLPAVDRRPLPTPLALHPPDAHIQGK